LMETISSTQYLEDICKKKSVLIGSLWSIR